MLPVLILPSYIIFLDKALSNKVDIFSPCKLLSHQKIDEYYLLKTSEGNIKTQYLIIATNGYSEKDIGNEHYNIIGVPSYIAATNILGQEKVQNFYQNYECTPIVKTTCIIFAHLQITKEYCLGHFLFGPMEWKKARL